MFTPWNEICPKNYLSLDIPVDPLWQNSYSPTYTTCPPEFLPAVLLAGWRIPLGLAPWSYAYLYVWCISH
jgi:hypothetical protein